MQPRVAGAEVLKYDENAKSPFIKPYTTILHPGEVLSCPPNQLTHAEGLIGVKNECEGDQFPRHSIPWRACPSGTCRSWHMHGHAHEVL